MSEEQPAFTGAGRSTAAALEEQPLELILAQWHRSIWWTGVRPMLQRMLNANLTMAEALVMRTLRLTPMTVAEAAEQLMLSHSAASRAIDRLVCDGYIDREENPDDRRQKRLTLTPQGAVLVGNLEGCIVGSFQELLGYMDDSERATMRTLMAAALARRAEQRAAGGEHEPTARTSPGS